MPVTLQIVTRGLANLSVSAVASAGEVDAMSPVTIAYTVSNVGEDYVSTLRFAMSLPTSVELVSLLPDIGHCNSAGGAVICDLGGPGAGAESVNSEMVFEPQRAGSLVFEAAVAASANRMRHLIRP